MNQLLHIGYFLSNSVCVYMCAYTYACTTITIICVTVYISGLSPHTISVTRAGGNSAYFVNGDLTPQQV